MSLLQDEELAEQCDSSWGFYTHSLDQHEQKVPPSWSSESGDTLVWAKGESGLCEFTPSRDLAKHESRFENGFDRILTRHSLKLSFPSYAHLTQGQRLGLYQRFLI